MSEPQFVIQPVTQEAENQLAAILPAEHEGYFKATEAKHFVPETAVGSLFTGVKSLNELLGLAIQQRGSLEGDDREKFIALGAKEGDLMPQCRYLMVKTPGEVGIVNVKDLAPDTQVQVVRTKPGAPCSLIVLDNNFPVTDIGTIVVGPNEKSEKPDDPERTTKEMIWTVHPGLPVRPLAGDVWPEGSVVTVQDVIEKIGNDVFLNVKKK